MKGIPILMTALALASGCITNYYGQYYVDVNGAIPEKPLQKSETVVLRKVIAENDVEKVKQEGYELIGASSFSGPYTPLSCAVDTAREKGASLVLTDIRFKETKQALSMMYVPSYTTIHHYGYDYGWGYGHRGGWYSGYRPFAGTTTVTSMNAVPVQTNVDIYSHEVMFFRRANPEKGVSNEK